MTPSKPKDPKTARIEQQNIDKPEDNDLINNLRRMFETLKAKPRNSPKK